MLVKLTSTTTVASDCNIYTGRPRPTPAVAETNCFIPPCTISALSVSDIPRAKYEGWSISNEKIRDANDYGQIHFTVFQHNLLQAQRTFPIDVLASLHRPRRTVCLSVRTSHLSCGWPLNRSQSSVHEANLSKIGTRGSQFSVVNTSNSLPSLQVVNHHPHYPRIPTPWLCHT